MTTDNVEEQVIDVICEQLSVSRDKVKPDTSLINDLGADSLDIVEVVMELEDKFQLSIPDEEAEKIKTIGDAVAYIRSKV